MPTKSQMRNEVAFRRPVVTEAVKVQTFFKRNLADNFAYFPQEAHQHYSKPWETEILARRLAQQQDLLICAWDDDNIVGMVSGTSAEGGIGTIIWLTVDRKWQNQKIGAKLLEQAKSHYHAIGAHKLKLTVHDKKAVSFYEREGMIIEALHPQHWWKLDFWEMAYFLRQPSSS